MFVDFDSNAALGLSVGVHAAGPALVFLYWVHLPLSIVVVFSWLLAAEGLWCVRSKGQLRVSDLHFLNVLLLLKSLVNNSFNLLLGCAGHIIGNALDEAVALLGHSGFLLSALLIEVDSELLGWSVTSLLLDELFCGMLGLRRHILSPTTV